VQHLVTAVWRDPDADGPGGQAPGVLPGVLLPLVQDLKLHLEPIAEGQTVRRGGLEPSACCGDESIP
jgi:hypothetical protein